MVKEFTGGLQTKEQNTPSEKNCLHPYQVGFPVDLIKYAFLQCAVSKLF